MYATASSWPRFLASLVLGVWLSQSRVPQQVPANPQQPSFELTIANVIRCERNTGRLTLTIPIRNPVQQHWPGNVILTVTSVREPSIKGEKSLSQIEAYETADVTVDIVVPDSFYGRQEFLCVIQALARSRPPVKAASEKRPVDVPPPPPPMPPLIDNRKKYTVAFPSELLGMLSVVVLALVLACVVLRLVLRARFRRRWEIEASTEDPPKKSTPCTRHCQKKVNVELERYRLVRLAIALSEPDSDEVLQATRLTGSPVDDTQALVDACRRRRKPKQLERATRHAAETVGSRIAEWLERYELAPLVDLSIMGRIAGTQVSCTFTLRHYRRMGKITDWKQLAEWTVHGKDERDEPVGVLRSRSQALGTELVDSVAPVLRAFAERMSGRSDESTST